MKAKVAQFRKPCEWCGASFVPHDAMNSRFCDEDCASDFVWALMRWAARQWVEGEVSVEELAAELEVDEVPDGVA